MERFASILLFLTFGLGTEGEIRLSLNSDQLGGSWIVWNQNKSIQIPAKIPGGIYTDLQTGGILSDNLFYRFNDIEYRWVAKDNWTYQTMFEIPKSMMNKSAINLVFHGIDTVGEIFLNGKLLSAVNNMFVRYVLPIKGIVREKNNILQVRLVSPIHEANRLAEIQKKLYPVPPECTPSFYNGECHVNFLRKMQASFAWDWGPAFPSVGIWKSVEIEAFDLGVIRDLTATPVRVDNSTWQINSTIHIEYADDYKTPIITGTFKDLSRKIDGGEVFKDLSGRNHYRAHFQFPLQETFIETWWPNGFGDQPLYDFTVSLESLDSSEISLKTVKMGFRTIELVQEPLQPDVKGLSFYFKVNGIPMFMKGSNWIPAHILPELGYDETKIRYLLKSAKDTHMNMLRVWGGGVYESDKFYSIADELGILIWQDMMFACAMYPTDEKFLENIRIESEQQIRRLQHHPSIAVWAGNNENEAALVGNWYGTSKNFTLYKEDYVKLYVDTIKSVVLENDHSRSYLTSSPSNGIESEKEGYIAKDPYSPLFGDVHYYNYIFDGWSDYTFPDTRFGSEYGFQAMPSYESLAKVSLPSDRNMNSIFTKKRQHLLAGNDFMAGLIHRHLPLPQEDDDSELYYKTFIYYSQISQAMSTKTETEKYRRDRSKLDRNNRGQTMGAMYWQLNDVWQAPSWSSIEFGGKWKMLHYFAKKFFSPVLVSAKVDPAGHIRIFLTSDLLVDVPNVRLNISLYSWDNFTPKKVHSLIVLLNKASSKNHKTFLTDDLLNEAKCTKSSCFVYLSVEGPNIFSDNLVFPGKLNQADILRKPNLSAKVTKTTDPSTVRVQVTTDKIAPFVWLDSNEEGEFSDNGFMALRRETNLMFQNRNNKPVNVDNFKSTLKIKSIY